MRSFFLHIILLMMLAMPAFAQKNNSSVSSLKTQREKTLKEIEKTKQMLNETKKSETATINKLNILNQSIKERRELIGTLNNEIGSLDAEMEILGTQRDSLQIVLETLKADYANLVRRTHYARAQESPLLFILSAKDFQQMVRRIRYMQDFQTYRKMQVARIEEMQTEIDTQNEMLAQDKANKEEALKVQEIARDNLTRDEHKQQAMLKELKKKEKDLAAQQKKQQQKANELNKKIEEAIAKEMEKKPKMTKEQELVAGGFEKNKGRLPWPVEKGFIVGHFGIHPHPTLEKVTVNNKGIYIQTTKGAKARAAYEGEVTSVMVLGGTTAVIITHGNYRTVYSGLSEVHVSKGDKVTAKQAIGTIYTDPDQDNSTQLFFQVWKDRELLDPEAWITKM